MITKKDIYFNYGIWICKFAIIPKGSKIEVASNLDAMSTGEKRYWLKHCPRRLLNNIEFESYYRNYGILIYESDLK